MKKMEGLVKFMECAIPGYMQFMLELKVDVITKTTMLIVGMVGVDCLCVMNG